MRLCAGTLTKKKLRLEILSRRLDLGKRVVTDQIGALQKQANQIADVWFGESASETVKRRKLEQEIARLRDALKQLEKDEKEFQRLQSRPLDKGFYRNLRKLEGAEPDGPHNFVWRLDFPHVLARQPAATLAGEMAIVNEAQAQQEILAPPLSPKPSTLNQSSGFDILVGNPPFVTARNPEKRELHRERWPGVCHKKFLLVCPFFEVSFGLLISSGQLGFIVSNAFAKREFGKPLVEDFLPTVDVQKIVDCSGLLFPGHGTPTCLVFGAQRKSNHDTPVRVAAILPGGGDLRTPPEESPLWHTLAEKHDQPGYTDAAVVVADRTRGEMAKWPWNFDSSSERTQTAIQVQGNRISDFVASIGVSFFTNADEVFLMPPNLARRQQFPPEFLMPCQVGEDIRNWCSAPESVVLKPYDEKWHLLDLAEHRQIKDWLSMFRKPLGARATFAGPSYDEAGETWYRYHIINHAKLRSKLVSFAFIATHSHFALEVEPKLYKQTAPIIELGPQFNVAEALLLASVLNSSVALFWLKQVCFNKGAGEDEHRDRFEYAGGKVEQLPVPGEVAEVLRGKSNSPSAKLAALSQACWERGRELPSLAMRKLFEKAGEVYHAWNAALPGYVQPHAQLQPPFASTADFRARFARAVAHRDQLRAEMVARQEEMDWLVYSAYGLLPADAPAARVDADPALLDQAQRPFRLLEAAEGDFERAAKLIPADWPKPRRQLWEARLAAIRDNEHVRRIEQPVYKRRWDEQWKVSNRWMAGPVAYAAEFEEAFRWWLAEKAEWHLENKAKGGPLDLATWTAALWKDARVQAAWRVVADAILTVEQWKFNHAAEKDGKTPPALDASERAFAKYFKSVVNDESVPAGIPPAVPWDDLAAKKKWTSAQLKKAQTVRGKLNVPRERFRQAEDGVFMWAGKNP